MGSIKLSSLRQKGKIALRESRLDLIADSKQGSNRRQSLKERARLIGYDSHLEVRKRQNLDH
jgi:hypothetical protein